VCTNVLLQLDKALDHLKKIDPMIQHVKLGKKKVKAFPDLLKVLRCHSSCTDFMI